MIPYAKEGPRPVLCGVYAILRKGSDEAYIGSSVDIYLRWSSHRRYLNAGTHHAPRMQNVWTKHGAEAFEFVILEIVPEVPSLLGREQAWLDRGFPAYNTCRVAGSNLGRRHSAEARAKMRGYTKTAEHRAKLSAAHMGRTKTPEQRARMAEASRGNKNNVGRVMSPEIRAALLAANLGRVMSAETRAKMSAASKAAWAARKAAKEAA